MVCQHVEQAVRLPMLLLLLQGVCWLHNLPMLLLLLQLLTAIQLSVPMLQRAAAAIASPVFRSSCYSRVIKSFYNYSPVSLKTRGICFCTVTAAQGSIWHNQHFCQAT
jgi:hypothetical protein